MMICNKSLTFNVIIYVNKAMNFPAYDGKVKKYYFIRKICNYLMDNVKIFFTYIR